MKELSPEKRRLRWGTKKGKNCKPVGGKVIELERNPRQTQKRVKDFLPLTISMGGERGGGTLREKVFRLMAPSQKVRKEGPCIISLKTGGEGGRDEGTHQRKGRTIGLWKPPKKRTLIKRKGNEKTPRRIVRMRRGKK